MILTCNSCGKKFVVPDSAISTSGRMVQCGSCGNKWKQFPISIKKTTKNETSTPIPLKKRASSKPKGQKRKTVKKKREINLYSPEYLAKKHGIKIQDTEASNEISSSKKEKVSFGFYNNLLVFVVVLVFISRILYFAQEILKEKIPVLEFYLNYFFENIRNVFEIFKDLVTVF